ncbi:MAG: SdpI family protein [Acidobacteriaceae bacterium]
MHDAPPGIAFITILLPIVNILISLPLCLRLVPSNRFYGFRTRKTLSSPEIWYEANYKGGVGLIVASMIALASRAALVATLQPGIALLLSLFALLVCMAVALIVWGIQVKNM